MVHQQVEFMPIIRPDLRTPSTETTPDIMIQTTKSPQFVFSQLNALSYIHSFLHIQTMDFIIYCKPGHPHTLVPRLLAWGSSPFTQTATVTNFNYTANYWYLSLTPLRL